MVVDAVVVVFVLFLELTWNWSRVFFTEYKLLEFGSPFGTLEPRPSLPSPPKLVLGSIQRRAQNLLGKTTRHPYFVGD